MKHQVEIVAQTNDKCGEAPTWDAANNRVLWVDNERSLVHELSLATGQVRDVSRELMVSGIALNQGGTFVFAGSGGLHVWRSQGDYQTQPNSNSCVTGATGGLSASADTGGQATRGTRASTSLICNPYHTVVSQYGDEVLRFNDIIADHAGRVYAGTLYWTGGKMQQHGKLYLISPGGEIEVVDDGIELSNGLAFSPDNRTMYYSDTTARRIYAYDVDAETGRLSNRRVFVQVPSDEGLPDGLTVDAEGYIWTAQWYGGQIVRYDPDGKVERRLPIPSMQVSSCLFGGPDLCDLYVTTAGDSWEGPYAPPGYNFKADNIGGPLYRVRLDDIRGKPEYAAKL